LTKRIFHCNLASPYTWSSGGVSAGILKLSLAQAPKSMFLQRSLQKGR
jgi:hypothetical protein